MVQEPEWLGPVGRGHPGDHRIPPQEAWKRRPVRVVHAFVVTLRGDLWTLRRTASGRFFPDGLEMGVGGHVERGEDSFSVYKREPRGEVTPTDLVWRDDA